MMAKSLKDAMNLLTNVDGVDFYSVIYGILWRLDYLRLEFLFFREKGNNAND